MSRLSHSAINKYISCGKSYEYHYIHKLREKYTSAALLFGGTLDNALNELLLGKDENAAIETFQKNWHKAKINNIDVDLPESNLVVYANADFDADLLSDTQKSIIENKFEQLGYNRERDIFEIYDELMAKKKKEGIDNFTINERKAYAFANWQSMYSKGLLMIKAYKEKVMPNIEKVYGVQKYFELTNGDDDKLVGVIDLICDYKGFGKVIMDNKTSAIEYEPDAALKSQQLTIYSENEGIDMVGYIVLRKNIKKNRKKLCTYCKFDGSNTRHKTCINELDGVRCGGEYVETIDPEVEVNVIISKLPERTKEIVLENIDGANKSIKAGIFLRNFDHCDKWGGCPYKKLCFENNDKDLIKLDK